MAHSGKTVEEWQKLFNEAFTSYKKKENKKDWDKIFLILYIVNKNVATAMLKNRIKFLPDFKDKVIDTTCNIMRLYIKPKKADIKSLGSFCKGYLMNTFWGRQVIKAEKEDEFICSIENTPEVSCDEEEIYVEIQGKLFEKKELINAVRTAVLPTQIKKIIENRV